MVGFNQYYGVMTAETHKMVPIGIIEGRQWAVDNGAYKNKYDPERFLNHLEILKPYRSRCLFATVPDKWGDSRATLQLWDEWAAGIKQAGWPVAYVAQDGSEDHPFPAGLDFIFIGGSDRWRESQGLLDVIGRARAINVKIHAGRINGTGKLTKYHRLGIYSADGTAPIYGPSIIKARFSPHLVWLNQQKGFLNDF